MNYHTSQPKSQISNTAESLIVRVLHISDQEFHKSNKQNHNYINKQQFSQESNGTPHPNLNYGNSCNREETKNIAA